MIYVPSRADVVNVQLDPTVGHEQSGFRPAIVLSDYNYNRKTGLATICVITTKMKGYPFEVQIPEGTGVQGVILANHIRAISLTSREVEFKCKVSWELYLEVWKMINTHIGP